MDQAVTAFGVLCTAFGTWDAATCRNSLDFAGDVSMEMYYHYATLQPSVDDIFWLAKRQDAPMWAIAALELFGVDRAAEIRRWVGIP